MGRSLADLCVHIIGQSQSSGKQTRHTAVMSERTALLLHLCRSFTTVEHLTLHLPSSKNVLQAIH